MRPVQRGRERGRAVGVIGLIIVAVATAASVAGNAIEIRLLDEVAEHARR
ncbi:hypothetical protein [Actinoplanes philippinensis]